MLLDLVFITKLDHLYTLNLSIEYIIKHNNVFNAIYIITSKENFKFFNKINYLNIKLIDEETVLPNMNFKSIKKLKIPYFPKRAGWYFQQLLKYGVYNLDSLSENYIVLDADTIILKPIEFIQNRKYNFLISEEYNMPYFVNYQNILKEDANRKFSFISQYMVFNKTILKTLLNKIEFNFNHISSWNWIILENLTGTTPSLFSEYETYGNFIKNNYPTKCNFIELKWLREGSQILGTMFPKKNQLLKYESEYYLISFEHQETNLYLKIIKHLKCKLYPYLFLFKNNFK